MKDFTIPDDSWKRKVKIIPAVVGWCVILAPYGYGAWLICSKTAPQDPSPERVCVVTMMYVIGVVLMMGADGQKYFTLREKKGLMNDGYMKWSRNPNYVGEMMIYGSFALLTQRIEPWYVLAYVWTLIFCSRMLQKDYSLSKKSRMERVRSYILDASFQVWWKYYDVDHHLWSLYLHCGILPF